MLVAKTNMPLGVYTPWGLVELLDNAYRRKAFYIIIIPLKYDFMALKTLPTYTFSIEFAEPANTVVIFGHTYSDYDMSMKLLKEKELRPITYKEALINISRDSNLLGELKGTWFYIANDQEAHKLVNHYFFNKRGKLTHGERDPERNIYAWFGEKPLSIIVNNDEDTKESGRRFTLDAGLPGIYASPVVLGIRHRDTIALPIYENTESTVMNSDRQAIKKTFRS